MKSPLAERSTVLKELRPVVRRALALARIPADALDDAEQRTLAALAPHVPELREKEGRARASYAFRAATRIAIRMRRKVVAEVLDGERALEAAIDESPSALEVLLHEERARRLHGLCSRLAGEDREVLSLLFERGMSEREAAETLGVSRGTIVHRMRRARQVLLRAWTESSLSIPKRFDR